MAISSLISSGDTIKISKSFGIIGSAVVGRSKTPIILVAANNNDPVTNREISINKPIVKMIKSLASIDGFLKQRLQNQNVINRNEQLNRRESQIEQQDSTPQIEVIKPDAERVDGSSAGLMAAGALILLTLDPVQKAITDIADGVVAMGRFVTGIAKTLNDVFKFFVGGNNETAPDATSVEQPKTETPPTSPPPVNDGAMATPVEQTSTPVPAAGSRPSFLSSVGSGAIGGAAVGSFVPKVGAAIGAAAGGVAGAVSYFTGNGSSSPPAATLTSAPSPTSNSSPAPAATTPDASKDAAAPGEIPKNDIVALGNYLIGKGAERGKMQHPAFGSVGEHSKNSRHYRGMAIDVNFPGPNEGAILDQLEPQLRAAGYNTIWRKPGHETHMHVSVGGPEGSGGGSYGDSTSSLGETVAKVASASLEQVGKLFGVLGSAIIKPGIPKNDIPNTIAVAARETNADIAVAKTEKPVTPPPAPRPPNINKVQGGATENPATQADKNSVYYYLKRFGYQDLSVPASPLVKSTMD